MTKFPPKKINSFYGYRTLNSMKSQQAWDFSQKYSAKEMIKSGIILALFSLLGLAFPANSASLIISVALIVIAAILLIVRTERAIKIDAIKNT